MALQSWELDRYQSAAVEVCQRLGEDPYQQCMDSNGFYYPRWLDYARRMAELHVMMKALDLFGLQ